MPMETRNFDAHQGLAVAGKPDFTSSAGLPFAESCGMAWRNFHDCAPVMGNEAWQLDLNLK